MAGRAEIAPVDNLFLEDRWARDETTVREPSAK
jgi:hypothetical protein